MAGIYGFVAAFMTITVLILAMIHHELKMMDARAQSEDASRKRGE